MNYKSLFPAFSALVLFSAIFFSGFTTSSVKKEISAIDIQEAIANAQIKCAISGNANNTHYHKPIIAKITNNRNAVLAIRVPVGFQFEAQELQYQNMLVTKTEIIKLNPNQTRNIEISAMCTESSDRAPGTETQYKTGKKASGSLLKLAELIESKSYFNTEAQNAVWALTDAKAVDYITGFDTTCARVLQKFICKETNQKLPPPPTKDDYSRNYYSRNIVTSIGGMYEFKFSRPTHVTIAMFNINNVVVRELYNNPAVAPGQHKVKYEFDATVFTDDVYYFKLIADGRVLLNRKMEMGE